jgi:hypothetical protein
MPEERLAVPVQPAAAAEAVHAATAEMPLPVVAPEPAFVRETSTAVPAIHAESAPAASVPVGSEPTLSPAPAVTVEKALQESGLVMIQTDPTKVKLAEPAAEPRFAPAQPRPRRAPPPDTGPLQIVETKK